MFHLKYFFFLRFLAFRGCIYYEFLQHKYDIGRVVQCHPQEPMGLQVHIVPLLRWLPLLTVYTIPSSSGMKS